MEDQCLKQRVVDVGKGAPGTGATKREDDREDAEGVEWFTDFNCVLTAVEHREIREKGRAGSGREGIPFMKTTDAGCGLWRVSRWFSLPFCCPGCSTDNSCSSGLLPRKLKDVPVEPSREVDAN